LLELKGFKVLDKYVRIMQNDHAHTKSIIEIIILLEKIDFFTDNLVFDSSRNIFDFSDYIID
jgi:hypothetical protein